MLSEGAMQQQMLCPHLERHSVCLKEPKKLARKWMESAQNEKVRTEQEWCMGSVPMDLTSRLATIGRRRDTVGAQ